MSRCSLHSSERKMLSGSKTSLIFAYGTLKQGFPNHFLVEELISRNDAVYIGTYRTFHQFPLVLGPFGIPYLINNPESGQRVVGELYSVSLQGLARLDEFEGTRIGHYERLPIKIIQETAGGGETTVDAGAYFAHSNYAEDLLNKCVGANGTTLMEYTLDKAHEYVKKENRIGERDFLDEIRLFISGYSH